MIELYINNRLCDAGRDFNVRLNRQLINPGELNTKDAQCSYSITLPPTSINRSIFNYANIEETKDKFNRGYNAELIVNGVRVFKGMFRLSEITGDKYKGNLYIPAIKGIKDIFGEIKLNENTEYRIEFDDFAQSVNRYNTGAANNPQMAIFPYVLYGVLPKVPNEGGTYTDKDLWDNTVRIGIQDFPPSINVLSVLKHIFSGKGYTLGGTAFNDERLLGLYMSYKNDKDYVQPWNYGYHAKINLRASWANVIGNFGSNPVFEKNGYRVDSDDFTYYSSDLLDAKNTTITSLIDPGANTISRRYVDKDNDAWTQCQVSIPVSGYYKIKFKASIRINSQENERASAYGTQFVGDDASNDVKANSLRKKRYEVKLLRDRGTGDFSLSTSRINRVYFGNNLLQSVDNRPEKDKQPNPSWYYPLPGRTANGKEQEIMFVDPSENANYVVGLAWGRRVNSTDHNQLIQDTENTTYGTALAAKTGDSWDTSNTPENPTKLARPSPGYMRYGPIIIDDEDKDDDPTAPPVEATVYTQLLPRYGIQPLGKPPK
jgi:hypothetical protein